MAVDDKIHTSYIYFLLHEVLGFNYSIAVAENEFIFAANNGYLG